MQVQYYAGNTAIVSDFQVYATACGIRYTLLVITDYLHQPGVLLSELLVPGSLVQALLGQPDFLVLGCLEFRQFVLNVTSGLTDGGEGLVGDPAIELFGAGFAGANNQAVETGLIDDVAFGTTISNPDSAFFDII